MKIDVRVGIERTSEGMIVASECLSYHVRDVVDSVVVDLRNGSAVLCFNGEKADLVQALQKIFFMLCTSCPGVLQRITFPTLSTHEATWAREDLDKHTRLSYLNIFVFGLLNGGSATGAVDVSG